MKRRCKVGDRARILKGADEGKVVLVVRKYHGEKVSGRIWVEGYFPWVVTSLGELLKCECATTHKPTPSVRSMVYDDTELEPLHDDDHGNGESTETDKPTTFPATLQAAATAPKYLERAT